MRSNGVWEIGKDTIHTIPLQTEQITGNKINTDQHKGLIIAFINKI